MKLTADRSPWITGCIGLVLLFAAPAQASTYNYANVDFVGMNFTAVTAISNNGHIVGYTDDGVTHGFLDHLVLPDYPSAYNTYARGVNSSGVVVGSAGTDNGTEGFQYDGTTYAPLNFGVEFTIASGINDAGNVVGWYGEDTVTRGFVKVEDAFVGFDVPGAIATYAYAINSAGVIAGSYRDVDGTHGFVKDGTDYTTFDVPDAAEGSTYVLGINDSGQLSGEYTDNDGNFHGFVLSGGTYSTLDFPGANFTYGGGINNFGVIVGQYQDSYGTIHGYEASQAPEPGPAALLGVGLLALVLGKLRRKR